MLSIINVIANRTSITNRYTEEYSLYTWCFSLWRIARFRVLWNWTLPLARWCKSSRLWFLLDLLWNYHSSLWTKWNLDSA